MTVSVQTPFKSAVSAGVATFVYDFRILDQAYLVVKVDGTLKTIGTDYTVTGVNAAGGGTVVFGVAPTVGAVVTIQRKTPFQRSTDYQNNGDFLAGTVNPDFDALWMALQDAQFLSNLAILLPVGDAAAPMTLPALAARASMFLAFDALGNAMAAAGTSGVPVSAFIATLMDDVNAAAARSTLGASASGANSDITSLTGLTSPVAEIRQIQPISASVAANAMTISASALSLEFRSATLTSGSVSFVEGTPANTVISSGSTGGTVSAVQSRIYVLAINNAGTIELAWTNASGGVDLSETGLISTTAEGGAGAADSANVIYSTTARTSVAYRVLGYIESTQATAGAWATAPSTIQGVGGNALTAMSSLGYGQTWQNFLGVRLVNTTYYNTTGKPITVVVTLSTTVAASIQVNSVSVANLNTSNIIAAYTFIVPSGQSYFVANASATVQNWAELR